MPLQRPWGGGVPFATRDDLVLLLIDHHRKPNAGAGDAIDAIFGSTALAGVVDAALSFYELRGEQETVLKVTRRDLVELELELRWLDAVALLGKGTVRDIADASGQEQGNAYRRLQALVKSGAVVRSEDHGQVSQVIAQQPLL